MGRIAVSGITLKLLGFNKLYEALINECMIQGHSFHPSMPITRLINYSQSTERWPTGFWRDLNEDILNIFQSKYSDYQDS